MGCGLPRRTSSVYLQHHKSAKMILYTIFKPENLTEFIFFHWNVNRMIVKVEMSSGILTS